MKDVARYFVHGVDRENVGAQLDEFAERHWDYMDAHSDRLVARGPTLSADRTSHTGSVHVVGAAAMEDARQFAFEEPYWLAGVYASVTVTRCHIVREATMWDCQPADAHSGSALVLVNWPTQLQAASAGGDLQLRQRLAESELVVFGVLLTSDDGRHSVGLVAAVDADIGHAAALVAGLGLPGSTTSITSLPWRRGGRVQPRQEPCDQRHADS